MVDVRQYSWVTGLVDFEEIAEYSFVTLLLQSCAKLQDTAAQEICTKTLVNIQ